MLRLISFFLLFFSFIYGTEDFVEEYAPIAEGVNSLNILCGEPSTLVNGCIHILTGDYVDMQTDLAMPGADDLSLRRFYCSSQASFSNPFKAWRFNHDISIKTTENARHIWLILCDAFGAQIPFRGKDPHLFP